MYSEPFVWRKDVTVCIAGINKGLDVPPSIFAVCDRKVSWGDTFTADNMAWKLQTVHERWRVMFAGDNSSGVLLVDAIESAAAKSKKNSLRAFSRLCRKAYREERVKIIETEVLAAHDISSYAEYLDLRVSDYVFFESVAKEIKQFEDGWKLLFLGFDE